jgi:hypothetical protein
MPNPKRTIRVPPEFWLAPRMGSLVEAGVTRHQGSKASATARHPRA